MEIAHHNDGNVTVAKMSDQRVDARLAGEFKRHLQALIESGNPLIALDLSDVDFIDSSGLGMMVRLLTSTRKSHGDLKLCNLPQAIDKPWRALVRWHAWPALVWMLLPKHLGYFLWFLSPTNNPTQQDTGLLGGQSRQHKPQPDRDQHPGKSKGRKADHDL